MILTIDENSQSFILRKMNLGEVTMPPNRPLPSAIQPAADPIQFQQMEVDYYMACPLFGMPHALECREKNINLIPVMRFYGVTMNENSVVCHVHGFLPYFYILAPAKFEADQCQDFQRALNNKIHNSVFDVKLHLKQNIYGFYGNQKAPFLKIILTNPKVMPAVKRILQSDFTFGDTPAQSYSIFESNLEFTLRFMIDLKVSRKAKNDVY
jgi:DNA polymerase delta subunit 1